MKKKLLVSIDDRAKVSDVAQKLASAGMSIDERDDTFRLVTGSADAKQLNLLKRVPGVRHVEENRALEAPEKDAAVQ
jgi:hypothetical protein